MLGVPMLAEDRVLGVIVLWRKAIAPFDDRTIALVDDFATQGAIAIQNVQTSRALEIASGAQVRVPGLACRTSCGRR